MATVYDVTDWTISSNPTLTAYQDIGAIINDIIADIKSQQASQTSKPGGMIYIPPGDYSLRTRVVVDISYLQIKGSGHGFTSLGIRYGAGNTLSWFEINPGASHVKVENTDGNAEAFLVSRGGNPRLSAIEFRDFCLDGVNFGSAYSNGKVGIRFATSNDSARVEGMGFVFLEHGLINFDADALNVTGNFITECGSCVELIGSGQASKVTNNHIGAGFMGFSIFAEQQTGLLIHGNNIFPAGASMVHLKNSSQCTIVQNRFNSFYPGMVNMEGTCNENLIAANHFWRQSDGNSADDAVVGRDELYGQVFVFGSNNMISGNKFVYDVPASRVTPTTSTTPTMILVKTGGGNFISNNHFDAAMNVNTVVLDGSTTDTKILDSGASTQVLAYTTNYALRPTP
jgi:inulin fructotransferase (DFA-I-forming)